MLRTHNILELSDWQVATGWIENANCPPAIVPMTPLSLARHAGNTAKNTRVVQGYAKVGGKSYRTVELTSVEDDTIHLDTLSFSEHALPGAQ